MHWLSFKHIQKAHFLVSMSKNWKQSGPPMLQKGLLTFSLCYPQVVEKTPSFKQLVKKSNADDPLAQIFCPMKHPSFFKQWSMLDWGLPCLPGMAVSQKCLTRIAKFYQDCEIHKIISDNKQYLKCKETLCLNRRRKFSIQFSSLLMDEVVFSKLTVQRARSEQAQTF